MSNLIVVPDDLDTIICPESPDFKWKEVFRSDTADEHGIDNIAKDQPTLIAIVNTAKQMQIIRNHFNVGITVSSWYRCPELNKLVGGSTTSEHVVGGAVDFRVRNKTPEEVYREVCKMDIEFNQLIQEYNRWTHYSFKANAPNKNQAMRFTYGKDGKTVKTYEDRNIYR